MIFDSHAHYDDKQFEEDRVELLSSMAEHNIGYILNVGSSISGCEKSLVLARKYDFIYAAIGIHPTESEDVCERLLAWMEYQTTREKVLAVGEIGLDYYWEKKESDRNRQRHWFRRQLRLAKEAQLPAIIHSRDAAEDTLRIIKEEEEGSVPGVVHCFSYSAEMAMEYVSMGYYIGVGGVVTFPNSKKLKETVERVPLEHIVVETDCPYLSPEPKRGERNTSLNLPYVIEEIARIKGLLPEEVENATYENAKRLYGLTCN